MARWLCLVLAVAAPACVAFEQKRDVSRDVVLERFEEAYYLQHPGLDPALLGLGPLEQLGWDGDVVVASVTRGGWRVIDARTHAGWSTVLSREEAVERVKTHANGVEVVPIDMAWRRLR